MPSGKVFGHLQVRSILFAAKTFGRNDKPTQMRLSCGKVCIAFCCVLALPFPVQSDDHDLGFRIGHFIGVNVLADLFKVSACRYAIKDGNPNYLTRNHFSEAVSLVRARYKDNVELQRLVGNVVQLSRMHEEIIRQTTPELAKSIGENPTPQVCGFINAEIDNRILLAKARLP